MITMAEEETEIQEAEEEDLKTDNQLSESDSEAAKKPSKKKKKKVVRRRKTKKEKEKPLTAAIRLAVESGEIKFGARNSIKDSLLGKAKLFVVASNIPSEIKERVEHYSEVSGIPVIGFDGTTLELGSVCGKPFPVSVLSVHEPGASPILDEGKSSKSRVRKAAES